MEVIGRVVKGLSLATIAYGVPTANLEFDDAIAADPGVYASHAWVGQVCFPSVTYVGPKGSEQFEVHIFDFSGDLYEQNLRVRLLDKISESVPWESEEQMKAKIMKDLELARTYFATPSSSASTSA